MSGLIQMRLSSNLPNIAADAASMTDRLGPDFEAGSDRLWTLPPGAPERPMVRSTLLSRMLVSQTAHKYGSALLQSARELKAAVDAARDS